MPHPICSIIDMQRLAATFGIEQQQVPRKLPSPWRRGATESVEDAPGNKVTLTRKCVPSGAEARVEKNLNSNYSLAATEVYRL